jgi:sec-independent protein translocase protein TatA
MDFFSGPHMIIIVLVIILLFGSKKIPDLAKHLGQGIKEFKKASTEVGKEADPPASKPAELDKPEHKDAPKA